MIEGRPAIYGALNLFVYDKTSAALRIDDRDLSNNLMKDRIGTVRKFKKALLHFLLKCTGYQFNGYFLHSYYYTYM